MAPPLTFKTNKTMAKKVMGPGPKKKQDLTKAQKQGMFNMSLVQGGSKNPAFNPEKYYPSMYGKGRVGDKPAGKTMVKKTTVVKKKK